jgi:hypothetical protein
METFDLDKVIAEEQGAEPFVFTFDGEDYELPGVMDVRVIAKISEGDLAGGLRLLIGDEPWQQIQESPQVLSMIALSALFDAYAKHTGVDGLGESSGSVRSLNRAARRSKRTSPGTTAKGSASSARPR